jgi:FkbM family methyltransferase
MMRIKILFKEMITKNLALIGYRLTKTSNQIKDTHRQNMNGLFERFLTSLENEKETERKACSDFANFVIAYKGWTSSQLFQDLAYLYFCGAPENKHYFVEVGVGNGIDHSNNLMLEKKYSMKGLLIEPDPRQKVSIKKNRKAHYIGMAASASLKQVEFTLTSIPELSWSVTKPKDALERKALSVEKVKAKRLNDILTEYIPKDCVLDFLSVDVEGSELDVLDSFDLSIWKPRFVCVEHNYQTAMQEALIAYFCKDYDIVLQGVSGCDFWFVRKDLVIL